MSSVQVNREVDFVKILKDAQQFLLHKHCYVGIPEDKTSRNPKQGQQATMNNAQLMYLHENGDPAQHIPPRPAFALGMQKAQPEIQSMVIQSAQAAFSGDLTTAQNFLERAGISASNHIVQEFGSSDLVPNHPITIQRKGSSAPLIDTGQLRASITSVVKDD